MRAHFGLPSVESEELDEKRPITVNFEIPYFTVSGIQVGHLINIHHTGGCFVPFLVSQCLTTHSLKFTNDHFLAKPNFPFGDS